MSSTTVVIPKDSTFKLPEGRFPAQISQFKVKEVVSGKGKTATAMILFDVLVPGMENYECLARKVMPLDLKSGSLMRRFLESLLGANFFKSKSNQPVDLQKILVGQLCWVELIHAKHDEDRFDFPLVDINAIEPRQPEPEPVKEVGKD